MNGRPIIKAIISAEDQSVCHSREFVNKNTGAHTQGVEGLWSRLNSKLRDYNGLNGQWYEDKLIEALWKLQNDGPSRMYLFWKYVKEQYPMPASHAA